MSRDQEEARPEDERAAEENPDGAEGGFLRHTRAGLRFALVHVWRLTGSVLLYLLTLVVLPRFVSFASRPLTYTVPDDVEVEIL